MSNPDDPRDLLDELETLQRVLDDAASDQVDRDQSAPSLDPLELGSLENIPVLDELFGEPDKPAASDKQQRPGLRAVPDAPAPSDDNPAPGEQHPLAGLTAASTPSVARVSGNPFLPQAILDKLAHEREAAQYSAEQAQATMAKIMGSAVDDPFTFDDLSDDEPEISADAPLAEPAPLASQAISDRHKAAIINELVEEMLPQIEARLRQLLADKL
ncbi:hypothetical protein [Bacterioplanoides pacificum]|uniref:Uncharacterized protein n=1 Tax=Bacterioplanoides pacificum TaxID=1171596 RepID=A0ABV7VVW4_9GAMM